MTTSNTDLEKLAKQMNIKLNGVVSKDELNTIPYESGLIITNLANNDKSGTHWTSIIIYNNGNKLKPLYMDSYGMVMPNEIENYLKKLDKHIPYSNRQIQQIFTEVCGFYCLSLAYYLQYKRKHNDILQDFNDWLSMFSDKESENEKILKESFSPYNVDFYKKSATLKKN
jgi:hypothetical protein